jgi:hypothetical protein
MESEYIALAQAAREARYYVNLSMELSGTTGVTSAMGAMKPIVVWCDNAAAIAFAQGNRTSKNSKHIRLAHHVAKDAVERGEMDLRKVDTANNLADMLTKPLSKAHLEELRAGVGISPAGEDGQALSPKGGVSFWHNGRFGPRRQAGWRAANRPQRS